MNSRLPALSLLALLASVLGTALEAQPQPNRDAGLSQEAPKNSHAPSAAAPPPAASSAAASKPTGAPSSTAAPAAAVNSAAASKPTGAAPSSAVAPAASASSSAAPKPVVPAAPPPGTGQVIVEIAGLHSAQGQLLGAIFRSEKGFPNQVKYSVARKALPLREKRASFVFDALPAGEFAFAVHHDENSNAKMETGLFGIPSEGYGTSRDAKANFGPPSYDDAKLKLAPGEHKRIVVHIVY